ncbi:MAG TPA: hypothetical protein VMF08_19400, partial [Candidatus Sulfotelmatobacter sp.]|nr:hypothetical protein [Candidatus Sulfotelmatobacter sp.]
TALVIVAENLRALLRRVMGTITGRIFHTLTLTELPQPCLAGVSNTDTLDRTVSAIPLHDASLREFLFAPFIFPP